jgi:hypothetical protein
MSVVLRNFKINELIIQSLDGTNTIDISNSLITFDYYEDILSPCVTAKALIANTSSLFNTLPIRGGEKLSLSFSTGFGEFLLDREFSLYVHKVSMMSTENLKEAFVLDLISREGLANETTRCEKRYEGNVRDLAISILKNELVTTKFKQENIEKTKNSISFLGNNRKPFTTLTWLCPKSISVLASNTGLKGEGENAEARGTSGFIFYENRDGFNFKSVDSLVSQTRLDIGSADIKSIPVYSSSPIIETNQIENEFRILNHTFMKNVDLVRKLRVGTYVNKTYFYDLYENKFDVYKYKLKDQIVNKLGTEDKIALSEEFGNSPTRIMSRISDRGALRIDGSVGPKELSGADMAMAYSRYNLLFNQAINIHIPCNINLKAGDIIKCEFPDLNSNKEKGEVDSQRSGIYLIKELCHRFDGTNMVTSIGLVRDSYGLYGKKT